AGKVQGRVPGNVGRDPLSPARRKADGPPAEDNRFSSNYLDVHWTPLYLFGHGLSYTRFEYAPPQLASAQVSAADPRQSVRVRVTNAGPRAGAEVVQLYLRDDVASVTRPVRELRG